MRRNKIFKFYLCDPANQGTFFVDIGGNIQTTNVPTCLKNSPMGWEGCELEFSRSMRYWGMNRAFTQPLKFVGDGAAIIRNRFYMFRGIEQLIMLVILKWNPDTDVYSLYWKGLLDCGKWKDLVSEGVNLTAMESGVAQILKTYENTMFEIPCDGSIPENIKINLDGLRVQDTFHYEIQALTASFPGDGVLPCTFTSNDGDNVGIIKGNPTYEQPTGLPYFQGTNYLLSSVSPISMQIRGNIIVRSDPSVTDTIFRMYMLSSQSAVRGIDGLDHAIGLVSGVSHSTDPAAQIWFPTNQPVVNGTVNFFFDATFNIAANENPFILFFNNRSDKPITIVGGNFEIIFTSLLPATRVWGVSGYDLFKLLVKNACALASSTIQQYNFQADSQLLQQKLNLCVASGDAIRASGDPNYLKFFNRIQTNPANPNFQFFNYYNSFGPVIKTSLADFFDSYNPVLNASMSNQTLPGENESVFFEEKKYVLDSSVVTMELGEVADCEVSIADDQFWNVLKIGGSPQQYDEKSGKYESNSTNQFAAPIRTKSKILELISKYRMDPNGIELTRANNTKDAKSTTYNGSDNSVFHLNADRDNTFFDTDSAIFKAIVLGSGDTLNGNQKPLPGVAEQGVSLPTVQGTYLRPFNDPSIFIFNQASGIPGTVVFTYHGVINGNPGDTLQIDIYVNGNIVATHVYTVTTANTPFTETITVTRTNLTQDCYYSKSTTSATCTATIAAFQMAVGSGYFTANIAAAQEIQPGTPGQLIPLAIQAGTAFGSGFGMNFGFPAFAFNEYLVKPNFSIAFSADGIYSGAGTERFDLTMWLNGVTISSQNFIGAGGSFGTFAPWTSSPASFIPLFRDMVFGDLLWATISPTAGMTAEITNAQILLTSTQILVYNLLRKQYDRISGVPLLLGNLPDGRPITTGPGAPFNIEDFSPKRMLNRNESLLVSTLFNLVPDQLTFLTSDKNQFLTTTLAGETITENAAVAISDMGQPLFYPLYFEFKTKVQKNFVDIMNASANAHIAFKYLGRTLYGFPVKVTQKPALDESQTWKLLCSPRTNLADLVDMNYTGLEITLSLIMTQQIFFSRTCPLQFVPYGQTLDPKYHFIHMNTDWFINQVQFWAFQKDYLQKVQLNQDIPVQCITNGITVVNLKIYGCDKQLKATVPMNVIAGPLQPPYYQLEANINMTTLTLPAGVYYVIGEGPSGNACITEGLDVRADWPMTLLFEYSNDVNKQSIVFSTGYAGAFRAEGWIDKYTPKSKFTAFEDQPADLELLNAISFDSLRLNIAINDGVPDWVIQKIDRIMLLGNVLIDGKAFTRETDAKWEVKEVEGWPKKYWSIDIRPAFNEDGISFNQDGSLNTDTVVTSTIDLSAFSNNTPTGPQLAQVNES